MTRLVTLKLRNGPLDGSSYDWDSARKGDFPMEIPIGALGLYRKVSESVSASKNEITRTTVVYHWIEGG
jgi:hypothetical protein